MVSTTHHKHSFLGWFIIFLELRQCATKKLFMPRAPRCPVPSIHICGHIKSHRCARDARGRSWRHVQALPEVGGSCRRLECTHQEVMIRIETVQHLFALLFMYVCMYVWMYVCTYARTYIRTYVRTYGCMYVRTYVCMYVCIWYIYSVHVYISIIMWIYIYVHTYNMYIYI